MGVFKLLCSPLMAVRPSSPLLKNPHRAFAFLPRNHAPFRRRASSRFALNRIYSEQRDPQRKHRLQFTAKPIHDDAVVNSRRGSGNSRGNAALIPHSEVRIKKAPRWGHFYRVLVNLRSTINHCTSGISRRTHPRSSPVRRSRCAYLPSWGGLPPCNGSLAGAL